MLQVKTMQEAKEELVEALLRPGVNRAAECARRGISRQHAYTLLRRYMAEGPEGLRERSWRPKRSPFQTLSSVEQDVLDTAGEEEVWGPRKIARRMRDKGMTGIPAPSTIMAILRRHGVRPEPVPRRSSEGWQPRERPNELWQVDFKGHVAMQDGTRTHPLMAVDDHARYCVVARSCADERGVTVQGCLRDAFRAYGLPEQMLMDNGPPWGNDRVNVYTPLVVWLIRLGIKVIHGRPRHPQTQGKVERLNLTLKTEVLKRQDLRDHAHAQECFDAWRVRYNTIRPHDALDLDTPASRYVCSPRSFPELLPAIEYMTGDAVRRVQQGGRISYSGREYRVPQCFRGYPVAIRLTENDGEAAVYFCGERVSLLDLRTGTSRRVRE